MINLTSAQATQTHMMTKLPNKHYKTHTTIKLHGETVPMTILAGLLLDLVSPSKFDKIHQCRTTQFKFSTLLVLTHVVLDPSKQGIEKFK